MVNGGGGLLTGGEELAGYATGEDMMEGILYNGEEELNAFKVVLE